MIKLKIDIKLPSLNEFIGACKIQRGSWNARQQNETRLPASALLLLMQTTST